jgi:transposase-like protein
MHRSRSPIEAFTTPIEVFTIADPGVHDPDRARRSAGARGVHDRRSRCSRWADARTMDQEGLLAPAIGVEERSDEPPNAGASAVAEPLDSEVVAQPTRRRFSAEYRLRILEEADRCSGAGEVGRLLRREGLYSSHLSNWRKARREGALRELRSKKRGARPKAKNPLEPKVRELEAKVVRLEKELHKAHTILDVQEKVAGLLGFSLEDGTDC